MMAVNKAMLWAVTAMAIAFLFFPQYFTRLLGASPEETITADMQAVVLTIEGMTCDG